MVPSSVKSIIDSALLKESETHQLANLLERKLPELRKTLMLPEEQPVAALMDFITRYIKSVPSSLRLVTAVSKRLGFFAVAAPFLHLAEDYFLQPPNELSTVDGLEALLDEAFLAHRLLEELNDEHIRQLQRPLLPVDMTEANIIVHSMLGEEFASRLEQLVQFTASQVLRSGYVWENVRSLPGASGSAEPVIASQTLLNPAGLIRLRLAS